MKTTNNEGTFRVIEGGKGGYQVEEAKLKPEQKLHAIDVWLMIVEGWLDQADIDRKRIFKHGGQDSKGYTDWYSDPALNASDVSMEEIMETAGYKMLMKKGKDELKHKIEVKKEGKKIRVVYSYWEDFVDEEERLAMAA